MTSTPTMRLTEGELDRLVSIAIRRAEVLDDLHHPNASAAWREVMAYEEQLALITAPTDITGGIARVGAVRAALAAGEPELAQQLANRYQAEVGLPSERHAALLLVFQQYQEGLARRFPATAQMGWLGEAQKWRTRTHNSPHLFPIAA